MYLKKVLNKSVFLIYFTFSVISLFYLTGCSKKSQNIAVSSSQEPYSIYFDIASYYITGKSSLEFPELYYMNEDLKTILCTKRYLRNGIVYVLEQAYPSKWGLLDGSGLYVGENDNASYLEELYVKIEEDRLVAQSKNLDELNSIENENLTYDYEQKIQESLSETIPVVNYVGKNQTLLFSEYDEEILVPVSKDDGKILIYRNKDLVLRNFYDSEFKLIKKENWRITSVANARIIKTENYEYEDNGFKLLKKSEEMDDSRTDYLYNSNGQIYQTEKYKTQNEKKYLTEKSEIIYDSKNNVKENKKTQYIYTDGKNRKLKETFVERFVYKLNEKNEKGEEIPSDVDFYENGKLKMRTKYSTEKGKYTTQIFFTETMSVKVYYENYKKIKEVYFDNNKVTKERKYE